MAFFPSSPSNNATTVVNGITYIYNTTLQAWKIVPLTIGSTKLSVVGRSDTTQITVSSGLVTIYGRSANTSVPVN